MRPRLSLIHTLTSLSRWILALVLFCKVALSECECGYSIVSKTDGARYIFADLLETDFVHVDITSEGEEGTPNQVWAPQGFNMTNITAKGPYGIIYSVGNVMSNTIADPNTFSGPSEVGSDAGLRLVVESQMIDGDVPAAQVATTDKDFFYGTFRAGIKITNVPGTCSAFFWYQNDTQEIDMEFLSSDFDRASNTFPVNLVLQSKEAEAGNATGSHVVVNLPFDPTTDFHEYRFDYLPSNHVLFLADGKLLADLTGDGVPQTPGSILLSHWSNGNPGWSRGPPSADAATTVSYVKAYFNSSQPQRQADFSQQCADPGAPGAVCAVPDFNATFFFTESGNQTRGSGGDNQTSGGGNGDDGGGENGVAGLLSPSFSPPWVMLLLLAGVVFMNASF